MQFQYLAGLDLNADAEDQGTRFSVEGERCVVSS